MIHDLRIALRQLFAAPGFCLAIVLTLALGVGVNTAVFSMLDGFLLRQLPYPQPDRIAALVVHKQGFNPKNSQLQSEEDDSFDGASWMLLKQNVSALIFASWDGGSSGVNLKSAFGAAPRSVRAGRVSADYFAVLGIPLYRGRSFTAEEDRPHGPPAVVISYRLFQSIFEGDESRIGKAIHLKGEPYTVVGVLPPNAVTPSKADLFIPLQPATTGQCAGPNCGILVRLKPGATWQGANAQLSRVRLPYFSDIETKGHGKAWLYARPLQSELAAGMGGKIFVLMLTVFFILVIATANLAGLTLVRMSRREPEIATRLALGASTWAIVRQLWTETLLLALLGGGVGIGIAYLLVHLFPTVLPDEMIPMGGLTLSTNVLVFALCLSLLTSLFFGALPALQSQNIDLRSSIASGSRTLARGSSRVRHLLIVAEVALTVVLLAAAGLLVRTLLHLELQPPGFDPQSVLAAKASLDDARYRDSGAFHALLTSSVAAMQAIPGVEDAAVGLSVPYERGLNNGTFILDGKNAGSNIMSSLAYVTPGYFSTLRIPLLAGRSFSDRDTQASGLVAVVNQALCKRFFAEPAPLGRHIRIGNSTYTIVGVVADVVKRPGLQSRAPLDTEQVFYVPATQMEQPLVNLAHIWMQPSWIVRSRTLDRSQLAHAMKQAMEKVDPGLPYSEFSSMKQLLQKELEQQRIEVFLLGALSGLALLLSAIGIYALVSNVVVLRTREIGIRMALGATTRQAMVHIGSSGIAAATAGVAGGLLLSFAALRVLSSEIYGVGVYDPATLTAVPALLILIAALASFLPTLRITRLQPADTLRAE